VGWGASFAAEPTGTIAGTVIDPSGASVPGAKVTVVNTATGLSRQTTTATDGGYVFPLLPVGTYNVVVEASGFRRFEQRGITVKADASSTVTVTMQLGAVTDTVTVESNAEMVETRSGTLSQTVNQQRIVELPLNGRNAATLVLLAPGTADLNQGNSRGAGDTQQGATYPGAQSITSNGARADGVNYQLDGGYYVDSYSNVNNPFPNPDALEEFSVQTNNYSAEQGRAAGAIVNVVTKSGTNSLHGDVFEFLRNGALNARNFFAPTADKLKRNQFGGSLGGPIVRDKLFFFGTYQGTQIRNISTGNTAFVLTPAQRAGNFSSLSRQLVDPVTKIPFSGNIIPTTSFSPITQKLLPLIPVSDSPDGFLVFDRPIRDHENQVMGRVDYNLTKQRMYGRYFYSKYIRDPVAGTDLVRARGGTEWFNQSASFGHTYSFGPSLLNNFVFSYSRNTGTTVSSAPFTWPSIGMPIAVAPGKAELNVSVSGYFSISTSKPGTFQRQNYDIVDAVHWIRGSHEIAAGGDILRMAVDLQNSYRQSGQFRFRSTAYSGDPRSDFLLGWVERFIQGGGEYAARRGTLGSLFLQDNWRVNRSLVLNLGLRWDPFVPYHDELGRTECFIPGMKSTRFPNAPTGYLFAGDQGCPAGGSNSSWLNLGPRVGFAWNLGGVGHTTLRGGYGIFYQPPFVEAYNNMVDSAPFSPQIRRFGVPFSNPYQGIVNPFPAQFAPNLPPSNVTFELPLVGVSYAIDWKPAQVQSWNLTLEHQLRPDLLVRIAYVGSKGTHLGYNTDVNPARVFPGSSEIDPQLRRPYQDFQQVTQDISGANSIYNGLQLTMEKRFSHGFTLGANYTWSRNIDEVSYLTDLDGINIINPFNALAYRGVADFDISHRFVMNWVWQLPSPAKHGALYTLLGGWETSGIWNWQSGFPLNITSGEDNSGTTIGNDQADVIATPHYTSGPLSARIAQWFTTSAFASNRPDTFGSAGRNILRGPRTFNVDMSLGKYFKFTERWKLQYRCEFFNAFNHTQLNNPDTTVADSSFGRITSARDPRIIQMALKLYW